MNGDIKILTSYIAAWGWHLTSIIFLCTLILMVALNKGLFSTVFAGAFFISFAYSLYMAHQRKREVYNE